MNWTYCRSCGRTPGKRDDFTVNGQCPECEREERQYFADLDKDREAQAAHPPPTSPASDPKGPSSGA